MSDSEADSPHNGHEEIDWRIDREIQSKWNVCGQFFSVAIVFGLNADKQMLQCPIPKFPDETISGKVAFDFRFPITSIPLQ